MKSFNDAICNDRVWRLRYCVTNVDDHIDEHLTELVDGAYQVMCIGIRINLKDGLYRDCWPPKTE